MVVDENDSRDQKISTLPIREKPSQITMLPIREKLSLPVSKRITNKGNFFESNQFLRK